MGRTRRYTPILLLIIILIAGYFIGWTVRNWNLLFPEPPGHEITLLAGAHGQNWQRSVSFLRGQHGLILKGGVVYNMDSHLDFHHHRKDSFTVGVQGGEQGLIRDLGAVEDLLPGRPALDIFTQIRQVDGDLFLGGKPIRRSGTRQKHAPVQVGHCYHAVIYRGEGHPDLNVPVLVLVLEYEPTKRVKIRWCLL